MSEATAIVARTHVSNEQQAWELLRNPLPPSSEHLTVQIRDSLGCLHRRFVFT